MTGLPDKGKHAIASYGLPRSGKSTIIRGLAEEHGLPIVNRDSLRLAMHGQRYVKEAEPLVKAVSLYMMQALFLAGHKMVLVDETNYSREARDSIRAAAHAVGASTYFLEVPTPPDVCVARAYETDQADLVPVIRNMWQRREPLEYWEYTVTLADVASMASVGQPAKQAHS